MNIALLLLKIAVTGVASGGLSLIGSMVVADVTNYRNGERGIRASLIVIAGSFVLVVIALLLKLWGVA